MKRLLPLIAGTTIIAAGLVIAGPLNPPPGPMLSTYKTLTEIEPRVAVNSVNTPGDATHLYKLGSAGMSYYLTADVYIPAGFKGILIQADGVTLDLNGFKVYGAAGSLDGITTDNLSCTRVSIRNGSVGPCGAAGLELSTCESSLVQGIRVQSCAGNGMIVTSGTVVTDCTSTGCTMAGFASGGGATFSHCTARVNAHGFLADWRDVIESCTAMNNTQTGFKTGTDCTVRGCVSGYNQHQGIVCQDACTITGCQSRSDGGSSYAAIWANGNGNRVENNETTDCTYGVYISGDNNTVSGNLITYVTQRAVFVSGVNNLIIQNTVHQSVGGFWVPAFNRVGAIVTPASNPSQITGTSGGVGLATTDPYANFVIN